MSDGVRDKVLAILEKMPLARNSDNVLLLAVNNSRIVFVLHGFDDLCCWNTLRKAVARFAFFTLNRLKSSVYRSTYRVATITPDSYRNFPYHLSIQLIEKKR